MSYKLKYFFTLIFIAVTTNLHAKIVVVASDTKSPIAFVQIIGNNGMIIGNTNSEGYLPYFKTECFSLHHLAYHNINIDMHKLKSDTIFMQPMDFKLGEISVVAERREFIRIKAYFRSYQYLDSLLENYRDGIIEYYVDLKKKRIDKHLLASSNYMNKKVKLSERKHSMAVTFVANIPILERDILYNTVYNKPVKAYTMDSTSLYRLIELDRLYPDTVVSRNLFGYHLKRSKDYTSEVYRYKEDSQSFIDIISSKRWRELSLQTKKDKNPRVFNQLEEIYVLSSEYITKDDKKKYIKTESTLSIEDIDIIRKQYNIQEPGAYIEYNLKNMELKK